MTRKRKAEGPLAAARAAAEESLEIASALKEGRLTRRQLTSWYAKRVDDGVDAVNAAGATVSSMARPIGAAMEQGRDMMGTMAASRSRPVRRRRKVRRHATRSRRSAVKARA
jgi:hypothetical protein